MQLNAAQVVALYALCIEIGMGTNPKFEITGEGIITGDVFVETTGDLINGSKRWRLPLVGGHEVRS